MARKYKRLFNMYPAWDYRRELEELNRQSEQGWEYIRTTFNGWSYFRKPWDPSLPEEQYEIFTDQASLREMTG